jgi:hypothetical protein
MRAFRSILMLVVATSIVYLSGCQGVNPSSLLTASSGKTLHLVQPFIYDKTYAISGNKFQYTLSPGLYPARYEDNKGNYYEGSELCFKIELVATDISSQRAGLNKPNSYRCGVFVPTASTKPALIYIYFTGSAASPQDISQASSAIANNSGAAPMQAGVGVGIAGGVVTGLQAAEENNFHFFENQPGGDAVRNTILIQ